jgi:bifunctional non-homologous end joining protein LigD
MPLPATSSIGNRHEVEVDGRRIVLSNLDRVLFPETGFTKADLIDYYFSIAPVMLPHLEGRPLTMRRFPHGVDGKGFWEKNCPSHRPDWVNTASVWSESQRKEMNYCLVEDRATLVWAANLADIELHTSLATAARRGSPTAVVFDLDPGEPAGLLDCAEVALLLRSTLSHYGLECFAKTSGSKGLQIYLPLNTGSSYDTTTPFAKSVAVEFERQLPDRIVSTMTKSARDGKIFIDWSQNSRHKTTVCVYSVRARAQPGVSTPLRWSEVEAALQAADPDVLRFSPEMVKERVSRHGDLFNEVATLQQELPVA